jgi:aspartate racemase
MRTIGLIGGVSWQSTLEYYRIINETVALRLGGHHSAKLLLSSLDFEEVEQRAHTNQWKEIGALLIEEAIRLEQAGADFLLIGANTLHKLAPEVQRAIEIPLLHIAQITAEKIQEKKIRTIGLLGTRFTMNDGFYQNYMERFEIKTLVPQPRDQDEIHRIIFTELSFGVVKPASLAFYQKSPPFYRVVYLCVSCFFADASGSG